MIYLSVSTLCLKSNVCKKMGNPPPAAGYPYPPPTPLPQPLYNPNPNPNPNPRLALFRRSLSILFASILGIGTISFIVWLLLRPRLPGFRVDSLSISNFNLSLSSHSHSHLTAKWDVRLTSYNPNPRIRLHYDTIQAGVFYRDGQLARTDLAPFVQGKKDLTALKASFSVEREFVERWVAEGVRRGAEDGRVDFNVRMAAKVKAGFWLSRKRWVRVYCRGLGVGLTAAARNGTLIGGRVRGCNVW